MRIGRFFVFLITFDKVFGLMPFNHNFKISLDIFSLFNLEKFLFDNY